MAKRLEAPSQNLNPEQILEIDCAMRREGAESIKARGQRPHKDAGYTRAATPSHAMTRSYPLTQRRDHILRMTQDVQKGLRITMTTIMIMSSVGISFQMRTVLETGMASSVSR